MKYLILIFIPFICNAAFYMSKSDIESFNAKDGKQTTSYPKKAKCEKVEGETCYQSDNKTLQHFKFIQVDVDDTSKPIYEAKSNVQACEGEACYELITAEYCPETYQAYVNEDKTEVYCTKIIGYKQKKVDKLVEDADLKAAYDQEQSDKETAKQLKAAKKEAAKEWLKNCTEEICLKLKDLLEL